jgi:hypothetical protein
MAASLGVSAVQESEELVGWWVSELLSEAASWGKGIFRDPRVWGTSSVWSRYQVTTREDTADWEGLGRAVVNCRVCELGIALYLLVVMFSKSTTNVITDPNPVCSHSYTWQYNELYFEHISSSQALHSNGVMTVDRALLRHLQSTFVSVQWTPKVLK